MIYYIDPAASADDFQAADIKRAFLDVCSCGAAGCRIGGLFSAYGEHESAARFWAGISSGSPACAVALCGGCATVCMTENADHDELREFLPMTGADTIFCESPLFPEKKQEQSGIIMQLTDRNISPDNADYEAHIFSGYEEINTAAVSSLLKKCECDGFDAPDMNGLLLQLSGLQRLGKPYCSIIEMNGEIISFAMTISQTDNAAILGAVCTHPDYRKRGCGGKCVKALTDALFDKKIYLMRAAGKNEGFYRCLGFDNCGAFFIYKA